MILRQLSDDEPAFRDCVAMQSVRAPLSKRWHAFLAAGPQPNRCGHDLATGNIADAEGAGLRDRRMGFEERIEFGRLNLAASTIDLILQTPGQRNRSTLIDMSGIPGTIPAIDKGGSRQLRAAEIPTHRAG